MKHLFKINLTTLGLLLLATVIEPLYGVVGLLPLGIIQLLLSLIIVFTATTMALRTHAMLHLSLGLLACTFIFSRNDVLTVLGGVSAIALLIYSFFITHLNDSQLKITTS